MSKAEQQADFDAASGADEIERERRAARIGCDDLDPQWPTSGGLPRGPVLCVLYPRCECGKKDRLSALLNNQPYV